MPGATGRQLWRPALIHSKVDAPGYRSLTTHIHDEDGDHLDSDTAFAVKPSAVRTFISRTHLLHGSDGPGRPSGVDGPCPRPTTASS